MESFKEIMGLIIGLVTVGGGLGIEEMKEITSVSRENIKMKLHRGRKKMYLALYKILKSEAKSII